jgi:hypothetical protein
MPMVVTLLFGSERLRTGAPDPVVVAEDTIAGMIDHCAKLGIDAGDVAALTILDLTARLCALAAMANLAVPSEGSSTRQRVEQ